MKIHTAELDISQVATIQPFLEALPQEYAQIDVLINNAGVAFGMDKVGDINPRDITNMWATNVVGLIAMTQAVVAQMKDRNSGDIVNIGSQAGRDPYPGGSIYCASKASIRSFTHALRKELIDTKIRVIEIDPGMVETDFIALRFYGDDSKARALLADTEPLVAEEVSDVIVYAVSRKQKVVIAECLVYPTSQAGPFHVYREKS